ncbi:MAG: RNA methyltransferase [Methylobacteriaceae bacterium]|nr:RNA methyltransferase [Methylobacteriaceae bacterium]
MPFIPVVSAADPRVEPFRCLKERDVVGRQGRFIAEGRVVLQALLHSSHATEAMLVSERQQAFLREIPAAVAETVPVYLAPPEVVNDIAGFPLHRGILGLGRTQEPVPVAALLADVEGEALAIGLVGMTNHDNVGGLFRNAAAFGCAAAVLDHTCCSPYYRKALRVSAGGVLKVPFSHGGTAGEMITAFQGAGFEVYALSPSGRRSLATLTGRGRVALLFGSEGPGLPREVLTAVETVRIPMREGVDSLNVAASSAVALYEMRRAGFL